MEGFTKGSGLTENSMAKAFIVELTWLKKKVNGKREKK
jgi:hypothetical protein